MASTQTAKQTAAASNENVVVKSTANQQLAEKRQAAEFVESEIRNLNNISKQMSHFYHNFIKLRRRNLRDLQEEINAQLRSDEESLRKVTGEARKGRKAKELSKEERKAQHAENLKAIRGSKVRKEIASNPGMNVKNMLKLADIDVDTDFAAKIGSYLLQVSSSDKVRKVSNTKGTKVSTEAKRGPGRPRKNTEAVVQKNAAPARRGRKPRMANNNEQKMSA